MIVKCGYCGNWINTDYEGISCVGCGEELCMKCQGEGENGECPICGQEKFQVKEQCNERNRIATGNR